MDKNMAASLINKLTSYTRHYAVVNIMGSKQGVTRFANSEISQNINQSDLTVALTLHDGKKEVTCVTNVISDEGLKKLAQDTEVLLAASPSGDFEIMPLTISKCPPTTKVENDGKLAELYSAQGRAEAIKEGVSAMGAGFAAAGALILETKIFGYGNSASGEPLFASFDNVQFNTVVTGGAGSSGGGESISHRASGLDIAGAFAQAKQRAVMGADPITLEGGEYTVILTPQAVADLVFYITWSLNAKRVSDGFSFCTGEPTGEQIFGNNINICDDVSDPRVFPWHFDYEGHKRVRLPLVEKGVVANLLYDNKTAAGTSTGHAITNKGHGGYSLHTVAAGGDSSIEEMVKSTDKGLFIAEFHYSNFVNPSALQVTGLTRNGTFLIENGNITRAVNTMRFTQNLKEAFNDISDLSSDLSVVNHFGGWACVMPAAKIGRFCFP